MATLTNLKIKDTYDGLLKTSNNEELGATGFTLIEDGLGNASSLSLGRAGNGLFINGNLSNSGDVYTSGSLFVASTLVLSSGRLLQNVTGNISMFTNDSGYLTSIPSEYLTQTEGDARYLQLTGGTLSGTLTATSFIKTGGTSSQFLKADGSIDSNTYLTSIPSEYLTQTEGDARYLQLTGGTLTGALNGTSISLSGTLGANSLTAFGSSVTNSVATKYSFTGSTNEYLQLSGGNIGIFSGGSQTLTIDGTNQRLGINNTSPTQSLDVVGNIKLSGYINDINISTVSGTVFINSLNPITFGTPSVASQDVSVTGYLKTSGTLRDTSGSDGTSGQVLTSTGTGTAWAAQTSGVGGSGTTGYLPKFTGTQTIGNSAIFDSSGNVGIGTTAPVAKLDVRMSDSNGVYGRGRDGNLNLENTNTSVTEGGWLSISGYMGNSAASGQYQMGFISGGKQTTAADGNYGGYLTFWTTSGGANGEANSGGYERMRIDSAGKVGIGTTSPDHKLRVNGDTRLGNLHIKTSDFGGGGTGKTIYADGAGSGFLGFISTTAFDFSNGTTSRMRIDSSGNVGIGTTSPNKPLTIQTSDSAYGSMRIYRNSATLGETSIGFFGTATQAANQAWVIGEGGWGNNGDFVIGNENGGAGGNVRLLVERGGNVGIGTSSPSSTLEIAKNDKTNGATLSITNTYNSSGYNAGDVVGTINFRTDDLSTTQPIRGQIKLFDDAASGSTYTYANAMSFSTGYYNTLNERMRIDSSGKVGIGTDDPQRILHTSGDLVRFDNAGASAILLLDTLNNEGYRIVTNKDNGAFSIEDMGTATSGAGTERMRIDNNGNFGFSAIPENSSGTWRNFQFGSLSMVGRRTSGDPDGMIGTNFKFTTANAEQRISADPTSRIFFNDDVITFQNSGTGAADSAITWQNNLIIDSSGNVTVGTGNLNLSGNLDFGSSNAKINLSRGGFITFYEDGSARHGIGSRNNTGAEADDLRINSYGAVYVNLDSNNNNTSGADFMIGRHGVDTGTISELFRISGETGNVGIGTTNPTEALMVEGWIRVANNTGIKFNTSASSGDPTLNIDSSAHWNFLNTAGNNLLKIDNGGNVGIDTTSPSHVLHVHSNTDNDYVARFEGSTNNSAGTWTGIGIGGESNNTKSAIIFEDIGVNYSRGKLHLAVNNETNQNSATKADAKLTVSNNGNVGIGTTSPTQHISGTETVLHIANTNAASINLDSTGGSGDCYVLTSTSSGDFSIYNDDANAFVFQIKSSGQLEFPTVTAWTVSTSNNAHQRADSRVDSTDYSRLHWYGKSSTGFNSNYRHAWYDGSSYVNVDVSSGGIHFSGSANNMTIAGNTVWNAGNDGSGSGLDADLWDGNQFDTYLNQPLRTQSSPIFSNLYVDNSIYHSGDTDTYINFLQDQIQMATAGSVRVHINSSGNVGIGTTSPASSAKVTVLGNQTFGIAGNGSNTSGRFISIEGNTDSSGEGSSRIFFTEHNSSTAAMSNYGMSIGYRGGSTSIVGADGNTWTGLSQVGNGQWGMWGHNNDATGTLIMYGDRAGTFVNFAGNVGIGTASPSQKLYVAGGNIGTSGYAYINGGRVYTAGIQRRSKLHVWSGDPYGIGMQSGFTFGSLNNDYAMTFQMNSDDDRGFWWGDSTHTNAQGAMALTTNGKLTVARGVRIGFGESDTTIPVSSNNVMEVTNELLGLGGNAIYAEANSNVGYGSALKLGIGYLRQGMSVVSDTTVSVTAATFNNPNGTVGSITFSSTSTSYNTSSDYRLKENVVPMVNALDKVSALKPSRFNFIVDSDKTVDGFLAHEVAEVVPEAINGEKDAVDDNGNPIYQGIDQSKLVPLLVGAIQELKAEIELLKQQINK